MRGLNIGLWNPFPQLPVPDCIQLSTAAQCCAAAQEKPYCGGRQGRGGKMTTGRQGRKGREGINHRKPRPRRRRQGSYSILHLGQVFPKNFMSVIRPEALLQATLSAVPPRPSGFALVLILISLAVKLCLAFASFVSLVVRLCVNGRCAASPTAQLARALTTGRDGQRVPRSASRKAASLPVHNGCRSTRNRAAPARHWHRARRR